MVNQLWDDDRENDDGVDGEGEIDDEELEAIAADAWMAELDPLYAAPLLSVEEERRLFAEYARTHDPALRERLILANTRLVRAVAKRVAYRMATGSLSVDDLEQEGMLGLMRAIEKYDVSRGYKFSTVATRWIWQAMQRAIGDTSQLIREPQWVQDRRAAARRRNQPEPVAPAWATVSLDTPRWDNDPESELWRDCLPDTTQKRVDEVAVDQVHWHSTLYRALARLSVRERYVLELRFGLSNTSDGWTLEEVGRTMNVTRERVRQIERTALTRLRLALVEDAEGEVALRMLRLVADERTTQADKRRREAQRQLRQRQQRPLLAS